MAGRRVKISPGVSAVPRKRLTGRRAAAHSPDWLNYWDAMIDRPVKA
jgi:hypothetical protein